MTRHKLTDAEYEAWNLEPPNKQRAEGKHKMGKKSKTKGKVGEREVVQICKANGVDARRLAPIQAAGGTLDAPDVEAGLLDIEVKRQKQPNIRAALKQAILGRRSGQFAVAATRADRDDWLATLALEDLLAIYADAMRWRERS